MHNDLADRSAVAQVESDAAPAAAQSHQPSSSWRSRIVNRAAIKRLAILGLLAAAFLTWAYFSMIRMPGRSFRGPLPPMTQQQATLADELRRDVQMLAGTIGRRNVFYNAGLKQAETWLEQSLRESGYDVQRQTFRSMGTDVCNIIVEIRGNTRPEEIVVIGAHYDSVDDSPAANDNGSGVAATLALARRFAQKPGSRTLRFVLFVNEEPPHFQRDDMGSLVYARACRQRNEKIVAMLSLETIGYYSDEPGSQTYPIKPIGWLYPDAGNFIGFVGNHASRSLVRRCVSVFRTHAQFPSEGAALPGWITGVGWSDQWAFWQAGYPGIMLTDTAPFRYPHYHTLEDTPDKIDYDRMARVVEGIQAVTRSLVDE